MHSRRTGRESETGRRECARDARERGWTAAAYVARETVLITVVCSTMPSRNTDLRTRVAVSLQQTRIRPVISLGE